ncbi:MAG: hypothetical protein GC164_09155 [Phycisphaera sp.]|nr:hypothetical protein [Phycisphaera sp.]
MTTLPEDFREFLRLLNEHGVRYLLVGGYAVVHHGYPRATVDIGIWIASSQANVRPILSSLSDFGFGSVLPPIEKLLVPDQIIRMGVPPYRIEVMTSIEGVDFEACYRNRSHAVIDGLDIPVISLKDLRKAKRSAGRLKDLADLENLPE